jgi:hypothetical protein
MRQMRGSQSLKACEQSLSLAYALRVVTYRATACTAQLGLLLQLIPVLVGIGVGLRFLWYQYRKAGRTAVKSGFRAT